MSLPVKGTVRTAGDGSQFVPRAMCLRCRRPEKSCYCRNLPVIASDSRVVILQHPRERDMPIGTGRMASLCLSNSELHVGVSWEDTPVLRRAFSDPSRPPALLYPSRAPGEDRETRLPGPVTLIVLDGTWPQTKKILRENPTLAQLPRVAFTPSSPSEYRIRREPKPACVSTIEALALALGMLEGQPERFAALLTPFRRMIERQIELTGLNRTVPYHHAKREKTLASRVPSVLRQTFRDIVCVAGEANTWPWRQGDWRMQFPAELVHWAAHRPWTGETLEIVVKPRHPLGPCTVKHSGLSLEQFNAGLSQAELSAAWQAFRRPSDIVCSWGGYACELFAAAGGELPALRFDLRSVVKDLVKRKIGTLEDYAQQLAGDLAPLASGRAGTRLRLLACVANELCHGCLGPPAFSGVAISGESEP